MALPIFEKDMNIIAKLSDEPNNTKNEGLDGYQLKDKFDEGGEALKQYLNEVLLPYLEGMHAAASLGIATISGISDATNVQEALEALKRAIDNTSTGAIPDASLGGSKLIAKTITARELADNSIGKDTIIDGAVAERKVADNGITKEKLADLSVEARHLNKQIISDENIADNSIDASGKLKTGSLTAKLFAAQSVSETAIVEKAVTESKIADNAVTQQYQFALPHTGWVYKGNGTYTNTVTIPGIKQEWNGIIYARRGTSTGGGADNFALTAAAFELDREQIDKLLACYISADNTLFLYASEPITRKTDMLLEVHKK